MLTFESSLIANKMNSAEIKEISKKQKAPSFDGAFCNLAERTGLEPATPGVTGRADMDFSALPILPKLLSIDLISIIRMTIGLNINDY
ncbi:hypothetical protein L5L91_09675 [Shewanella sp. SM55]|nr:hypothetical protein [Shewanella sp. SM55]